ncbi:MAG: SUF system NifU family Fe-S cluster assembly protein [Elusimicrobia bacterium]|nr:SUF system NifU family Fe-S cluster assembly protein [Elusimicrobiota bacterium]MDE2424543.1 SUF system NifU family Fe-S cluster assembly protein [Elusimicrobiota bacterium]
MEGDSELRELYREALLDYSRDQARRGRLEPADMRARGLNPVCGDEIELTMRSGPDGRIAQIRFTGHGCVISQASSAMMAEALEGQTPERAASLLEAFKGMMLRGAPAALLPQELEAVGALEGVRRFPTRVKCATLAWNTLQQGLARRSGGAQADFEEVE